MEKILKIITGDSRLDTFFKKETYSTINEDDHPFIGFLCTYINPDLPWYLGPSWDEKEYKAKYKEIFGSLNLVDKECVMYVDVYDDDDEDTDFYDECFLYFTPKGVIWAIEGYFDDEMYAIKLGVSRSDIDYMDIDEIIKFKNTNNLEFEIDSDDLDDTRDSLWDSLSEKEAL